MNSKNIDKEVLLSTVWIVVMFSLLKADILYIVGAARCIHTTFSSQQWK